MLVVRDLGIYGKKNFVGILVGFKEYNELEISC